MTKQYICIKPFPGCEEGKELTLTRGPYGSPSYEIVRILVCLSYFLDADEVENNPEYFKLVEEEPKEEGMLAYAAGYIPSSPIKHSITHEEYTKILKEAEMKGLKNIELSDYIESRLFAKEEKKGKLWRARTGESFWYIEFSDEHGRSRDVSVHSETEHNNGRTDELFNTGNYYRTEEDAQAVLDYQLFKTKMEDKYGYIDWEQTNEGTSADLSSLKSYEIEALYEHRKDYAKAQKNRFTTND